jgi:hypothetical protein
MRAQAGQSSRRRSRAHSGAGRAAAVDGVDALPGDGVLLGGESLLAGGGLSGDGGVAGAVGPAGVEVFPRMLRVGAGWAATLIVTGYPAEVGLAWLDGVLRGGARVDATMHIEPLPAPTAAAGLRKARARLEATRRLDADRGRLGDPLTEIAADDAADLADRLARGQTRLFRVGVYLTVHAPTRAALADAVAQVQAAAASVLLDTHPATWRHLQGWTSTLPLGEDTLRVRRVFDTDALALAFPLASSGLPGRLPGQPAVTGGVLLGVTDPSADTSIGPDGWQSWTAGNKASGGGVAGVGGAGVVWWDRWSQHNHNSLVLARSGAGKSYLVKLEILRSLYDDVIVAVIDPDEEYAALAGAVGGTTIGLGRQGVRVNPLDIPAGDVRPDALTRRALFVHTLVGVLLGGTPPPAERAALDAAITATYTAAGISHHPGTWRRPAPLLRDLAAALDTAGQAGTTGAGATAAATLAARLTPWTSGSFKDLFDGPTTHHTSPTGIHAAAGEGRGLTVWSTRHLPDELRPAGMLLALDAIWRDVDTPTTPPLHANVSEEAGAARDGRAGRRLVVVDEAWTLLREGEGARFLFRLAKAARKRRAGLTVITQDVADLLGSDLGHAVAANAATQILMRQAPQSIDAVRSAFALTAGEAQMLLTAGRGQALLVAGGARVAFRTIASPKEHVLAVTGLDTQTADVAARQPATRRRDRP